MIGFCECGCGQRTRLAPQTSTEKGWIRGQPIRFVGSHVWRVNSRFRKGHAIALGMKYRPRSAEHLRKLSEAMKGKRHSLGARAAMRAAWAAKSYEEKLRHSAPGRAALKLSKRRTGWHNKVWWNALRDEDRERILASRASKATLRWQALPEEERARRKQTLKALGMEGVMAARSAKPTTIELSVASLLRELGCAFLAEQRIGNYIVDFLIPDRMLVIECDGSYWHSKPAVKERDAVRDAWLAEQGYRVVRLPESDIRAGRVVDRLREIA